MADFFEPDVQYVENEPEYEDDAPRLFQCISVTYDEDGVLDAFGFFTPDIEETCWSPIHYRPHVWEKGWSVNPDPRP